LAETSPELVAPWVGVLAEKGLAVTTSQSINSALCWATRLPVWRRDRYQPPDYRHHSTLITIGDGSHYHNRAKAVIGLAQSSRTALPIALIGQKLALRDRTTYPTRS